MATIPGAWVSACLMSGLVFGALGGCHDEHWLTYPWDDRQVLCSEPFDDLTETVPWGLIADQMNVAESTESVLLLHAHIPGRSVSLDAIKRVLEMARTHQLEFLTIRDLDQNAPRGRGLALGFDDDAVDLWYGLRGLFDQYGAKITFNVSRWYMKTDQQRAELREMFDEGHDVEPHSVNHLHAPAYVQEHGLDAYMADEMQPSIDAVRDAGYPAPMIYPYPFGLDSVALDTAILKIVPRVRVSPAACPY
jgi:hypothetical protein